MSNKIFTTRTLIPRSVFQKLFKQFPEENALFELNNLLASENIQSIHSSDVKEIETRYNLSLKREFKLNLEEFYAVYLNECLKDKVLNPKELEDLKHLKQLLHLEDKEIDNLHNQIGAAVYRKTFEEAVADGKLTSEEEEFLNQLESGLKLNKELASKISAETRGSYIQNYFNSKISDHTLSPDEERDLEAVAKSLNVQLTYDEPTNNMLEKMKLYWAIENLELPVIEVQETLQKGENCYLRIEGVIWDEIGAMNNVNLHNYKVSKGYYLGSKTYVPREYKPTQLKGGEKGTLLLTNKRIFFDGPTKNSNLPLTKIVGIAPSKNGIEIGKLAGKIPVIQIFDKADIFCVLLERLVQEL